MTQDYSILFLQRPQREWERGVLQDTLSTKHWIKSGGRRQLSLPRSLVLTSLAAKHGKQEGNDPIDLWHQGQACDSLELQLLWKIYVYIAYHSYLGGLWGPDSLHMASKVKFNLRFEISNLNYPIISAHMFLLTAVLVASEATKMAVRGNMHIDTRVIEVADFKS